MVLTSRATRLDSLTSKFSGSGRVSAVQLDVTDRSAVEAFVREIHESFGAIHVLVNCTGTLGPVGPVQTTRCRDWTGAIELNLIGTFHLMQTVIPIMVAQGSGKIINFSGGGAAYGRPFFSAYAASKAAVVRLTESLAMELADKNIQLNCIAPGPVKSRMWEDLREAGAAAGTSALEELERMDRDGGVPAEKSAALALFLASERSGELSGKLIAAVWDKWDVSHDRIAELMKSQIWTLRRITSE